MFHLKKKMCLISGVARELLRSGSGEIFSGVARKLYRRRMGASREVLEPGKVSSVRTGSALHGPAAPTGQLSTVKALSRDRVIIQFITIEFRATRVWGLRLLRFRV